ncbi:hypothetical protein PYCC9005_004806 [Savitreella phatthalungensis]
MNFSRTTGLYDPFVDLQTHQPYSHGQQTTEEAQLPWQTQQQAPGGSRMRRTQSQQQMGVAGRRRSRASTISSGAGAAGLPPSTAAKTKANRPRAIKLPPQSFSSGFPYSAGSIPAVSSPLATPSIYAGQHGATSHAMSRSVSNRSFAGHPYMSTSAIESPVRSEFGFGFGFTTSDGPWPAAYDLTMGASSIVAPHQSIAGHAQPHHHRHHSVAGGEKFDRPLFRRTKSIKLDRSLPGTNSGSTTPTKNVSMIIRDGVAQLVEQPAKAIERLAIRSPTVERGGFQLQRTPSSSVAAAGLESQRQSAIGGAEFDKSPIKALSRQSSLAMARSYSEVSLSAVAEERLASSLRLEDACEQMGSPSQQQPAQMSASSKEASKTNARARATSTISSISVRTPTSSPPLPQSVLAALYAQDDEDDNGGRDSATDSDACSDPGMPSYTLDQAQRDNASPANAEEDARAAVKKLFDRQRQRQGGVPVLTGQSQHEMMDVDLPMWSGNLASEDLLTAGLGRTDGFVTMPLTPSSQRVIEQARRKQAASSHNNPLACDGCGMVFRSEELLLRHASNHVQLHAPSLHPASRPSASGLGCTLAPKLPSAQQAFDASDFWRPAELDIDMDLLDHDMFADNTRFDSHADTAAANKSSTSMLQPSPFTEDIEVFNGPTPQAARQSAVTTQAKDGDETEDEELFADILLGND